MDSLNTRRPAAPRVAWNTRRRGSADAVAAGAALDAAHSQPARDAEYVPPGWRRPRRRRQGASARRPRAAGAPRTQSGTEHAPPAQRDARNTRRRRHYAGARRAAQA